MVNALSAAAAATTVAAADAEKLKVVAAATAIDAIADANAAYQKTMQPPENRRSSQSDRRLQGTYNPRRGRRGEFSPF
jgi:hypothetical protein